MSTIKENFMTKDDELKELVRSFFDDYLNLWERRQDGSIYRPISVGCGRVMKMESLAELLEKMRELSEAQPPYEGNQNEPEDPLCKICGKVLGSTKECAWTGCPLNWGDEASEKRQDIIGQNGNVGYGEE
jgi:hypothetical protein